MSSEKFRKFTNVLHSKLPQENLKKVALAVAAEQCEFHEQWHHQTPPISAFVFCVLNEPLVRLKCEPPLGFWVRSHHCLCHHLLWLPNLCSRNQGSQTSTEANTMERGFNTFNRTQKSAPPLLHREHKDPNAWQDNCEVILAAHNAMRVGSLSCQQWPVHRQLNMLLS